MDVEYVTQELAKRLSIQRFEHVLRVVETAKMLAARFSVSVEKAEQAAIFHDIAKCMHKDTLRSMVEVEYQDSPLLSFHHELWHAPVGAIIARDEFLVSDVDVLNAIRYHTTGRACMSPLEKVIYVADLTEPGRHFPGVNDLRELALMDLDIAMKESIIHTVQYLVNKKVPVYPDSIDCYNTHVK